MMASRSDLMKKAASDLDVAFETFKRHNEAQYRTRKISALANYFTKHGDAIILAEVVGRSPQVVRQYRMNYKNEILVESMLEFLKTDYNGKI